MAAAPYHNLNWCCDPEFPDHRKPFSFIEITNAAGHNIDNIDAVNQ
jgi:hypothetical protein